jgi:hypothetical protein
MSREEALGKANQLVADCINAKDRQAQEVISDALESLYERIAELEQENERLNKVIVQRNVTLPAGATAAVAERIARNGS